MTRFVPTSALASTHSSRAACLPRSLGARPSARLSCSTPPTMRRTCCRPRGRWSRSTIRSPRSERGGDADQPGAQPCEPAVLLAAAAPAVGSAHPTASGTAQRIAYDVQQIDQSFSRPIASLDARVDQHLSRLRRALAGHGGGLAGRHAGAGRRRRQYRDPAHGDVGSGRRKPGGDRRAAGDPGRQPAPCSAGAAARRPDRRCCRAGTGPLWRPPSGPPPRSRAANSSAASSRPARLPAGERPDVPE